MTYNKDLIELEKQLLSEITQEKKLSMRTFAKTMALSSLINSKR